MLADRDHITQYIPQRKPMVMIDALKEASDQHAITQFTVRKDNIFVSEGYLSEPGLVENIAQTAAAQSGYQHLKAGKSVRIGYIAAVKNLVVTQLPQVDTVIETSVRVINEVLNVIIIEGRIAQGETLLCSCEIRIFTT
jgi:3-hydroxyacyl-[acyl-carrier-protein] dehydratase